jgi:hypothetical protein
VADVPSGLSLTPPQETKLKLPLTIDDETEPSLNNVDGRRRGVLSVTSTTKN